jgi:hypothetical protein
MRGWKLTLILWVVVFVLGFVVALVGCDRSPPMSSYTFNPESLIFDQDPVTLWSDYYVWPEQGTGKLKYQLGYAITVVEHSEDGTYKLERRYYLRFDFTQIGQLKEYGDYEVFPDRESKTLVVVYRRLAQKYDGEIMTSVRSDTFIYTTHGVAYYGSMSNPYANSVICEYFDSKLTTNEVFQQMKSQIRKWESKAKPIPLLRGAYGR